MFLTNSLEDQFNEEMFELYRRTERETNYNPRTFLDMLNRNGGIRTAQRLLGTAEPSDGYTKLYKLKRLDLTVEAFTWDNPNFQELFSPEELKIVQKRLTDYGYLK